MDSAAKLFSSIGDNRGLSPFIIIRWGILLGSDSRNALSFRLIFFSFFFASLRSCLTFAFSKGFSLLKPLAEYYPE
jgi:hypothetical protein